MVRWIHKIGSVRKRGPSSAVLVELEQTSFIDFALVYPMTCPVSPTHYQYSTTKIGRYNLTETSMESIKVS